MVMSKTAQILERLEMFKTFYVPIPFNVAYYSEITLDGHLYYIFDERYQ